MREGRDRSKGSRGHRGSGEQGCESGDGHKERIQSAQTFRRGRAIAFLERLDIKRSTLMQQLNQPEYDAIKQVLSGELKATDAIMQEFIHAFELREVMLEQDAKRDREEVKDESN
ncbi:MULTISPECIES: hypothetical protein [Paenibacillus]|uniref:hypothetical protein n=1 Tax=Paenibacillus TaxID=44249 RepID=UPI001C2FAC7E|nr:hypothetical protein [Paenibacillus agri]